jgi:hypothetical protein
MNTTNAATAPAADAPLHLLMARFPTGSRWQFHAYHPAIWPRDWRRTAERAPWGMRPGDLLEVTGYGATGDFPEALLMKRVGDSTVAMLFPPDIGPLAHLPATRTVADDAAAPPEGHATPQEDAQRVSAAQTWADDGGRL